MSRIAKTTRPYPTARGDSHNYDTWRLRHEPGCQAERWFLFLSCITTLWQILFLRFNAQAFCWLSSVEENRTSLLLSVFLCSILLDAYPILPPCLLVDICEHINSCRQKHVLSLQDEMVRLTFNSRQYSKLCWLMHYLSHHLAPWKTKHLLVFIRICRIKIDMLGYSKIWRYPQRLDDHIPPGLNGRLRFNGGLHRAWLARRGPALARKMGRAYWIWSDSMFADCLLVLEGLRF